MKWLVVSDTHRQHRNLENVLRKVGPLEGLIHLGDVEGGQGYIEALADCPVYMVAGNNDYRADLPETYILQVGRYRCFLTHGHRYWISSGPLRLLEAARERDCTIAMYGHTHRPEIVYMDGMTGVNPGSISYPRQENHKPSYVLMELDRLGEIHFTIRYVD